MKTIIFYGRAQMGVVVLSHILSLGYKVKVIPEDNLIRNMCKYHNLEIVDLETMGKFDLFLCCHGRKIIKKEYLEKGKFVNMHPCLWKYKGHDPIGKYIKNKDIEASVESHYMVEEVDAGEVIIRSLFTTPVIDSYGDFYNIALPHYVKCIDETLKKIWRKAAFTRVLDDKEKLELWLSYYSKYFEDLYVIGYGTIGNFAELNNKYPFTFTQMARDSTATGGMHSYNSLYTMKSKQRELLKNHEWVLYSDCDEFILVDYTQYKDLKDFMMRSREQQTFCEGYEIYQTDDEAGIDYTKPILVQRKYWWRDANGSYNKPLLSRIESDWTFGFHKLAHMTDEEVISIEKTGLYLIHLNKVNKKNTEETQFRKSEIPKELKWLL